MISLPLPLCYSSVGIHYLPLSVKLALSKLPLVHLPVFPFKFTWPIYLVVLEISLQSSVVRLNRPLTLPFSKLKLPTILYSSFRFNSSRFIMHQTFWKLASIFTGSIVPWIYTISCLNPVNESTSITCILLIVFLCSFSVRIAVFPLSLKTINVFVR